MISRLHFFNRIRPLFEGEEFEFFWGFKNSDYSTVLALICRTIFRLSLTKSSLHLMIALSVTKVEFLLFFDLSPKID